MEDSPGLKTIELLNKVAHSEGDFCRDGKLQCQLRTGADHSIIQGIFGLIALACLDIYTYGFFTPHFLSYCDITGLNSSIECTRMSDFSKSLLLAVLVLFRPTLISTNTARYHLD